MVSSLKDTKVFIFACGLNYIRICSSIHIYTRMVAMVHFADHNGNTSPPLISSLHSFRTTNTAQIAIDTFVNKLLICVFSLLLACHLYIAELHFSKVPLFHCKYVLVKSLTVLNTRCSTVRWKEIQMRVQKMYLK